MICKWSCQQLSCLICSQCICSALSFENQFLKKAVSIYFARCKAQHVIWIVDCFLSPGLCFRDGNTNHHSFLRTCWFQLWAHGDRPLEVHYTCGGCNALSILAGRRFTISEVHACSPLHSAFLKECAPFLLAHPSCTVFFTGCKWDQSRRT